MNPTLPAFVTPFPAHPSTTFTGSPLRQSPCIPRPTLVMVADRHLPDSPWDGIRRVIRVSAISASLLMASALPVTRQTQQRMSFFSTPSVAASTQTTPTPNSTSDVEAAAMTLGAVTVGGLVMRAIINSRRDEDEERRRLQAECDRLQQQEQERSLRVRRKQMENLDGDDVIPDDQLLSDFMNRVKSLEEDDPDLQDPDNADASMRHSPIPDRGMGSAVLDRPDETDDDHTNDDHTNDDQPDDLHTSEELVDQAPEMAKPEEAEMLKRMWNLSSPDKE